MLTPADISNRTIKTTMGGYNKKDTDEFIASILESFEELNNENKKLKEQLSSLSDGIQYYKNLEDNLQKALVLAEKTSDETKNAAKAEAANIVSLAKAEAADIISKAQNEADTITKNAKADTEKQVSDAQNKAAALSDRLSRLISSFEKYKKDIKAIVENQLEFIESEDYSTETPIYNDIDGEITYTPNDMAAFNESTVIQDDVSENDTDITENNMSENSAIPENDFNTEDASDIKNEDNLFKWTSVTEDSSGESALKPETDISNTKDEAENTALTTPDTTHDSDNESHNIVDDNIIISDTNEKDINDTESVESEDITTDNDDIEDEDDIVVENIMTTPTLNDIEGADVSNTVFPAHKPDKNSVSYLAEDQTANVKDKKNAFTFIDLD